MPGVKKVRAVEELADKLSKSSVAIATDFRGTPVNTMTGLRKHLRSNGMEYGVLKNTLTVLAADAAGRPEAKELLDGPTALAFGYGDPVEQIKVVTEYVRANRLSILVRAAMLDGRVFTGAEFTALAALPSRDVLRAQLVGHLASPFVRLVMVLNQPLQGLASVLQQRIAQQEGT